MVMSQIICDFGRRSVCHDTHKNPALLVELLVPALEHSLHCLDMGLVEEVVEEGVVAENINFRHNVFIRPS